MEPFGLFHLLQSLADALPKNGENAHGEQAEPTPPDQPEPPQEEPLNVCAEFLAMHEARAKKTRKK